MSKTARKDNPSSIFYWKDYENDEGLRVSSLAAQGLWMRLLCVAAKADPYGYILINGCEIGVTGVARLGSVTEAEAATLLDELERNGVFSRDRKGRAFSRRMVKDATTRAKNTKNGKKGGNPRLSVSDGKEREKERSVNPPVNPPLKPPYHIPHTPRLKEDGGGDSAGEILPEKPPDKNQTFREKILDAIGVDQSGLTGHGGKMLGNQSDMAEAERWLALPGLSEPVVLAEVRAVMSRKRDGPPSTFRFFSKAMERLSGSLTLPPLTPTQTSNGASPNERNRQASAAISELSRRVGSGEVKLGTGAFDNFER